MALGRNRTELTPGLSSKLVAACGKFPTFDAICRACWVEPYRVREWLKLGQLPHAEDLYADFSTRFLSEDATYQERLSGEALDPYRKSPKVVLDLLELRQSFSTMAEPDPKDVAEDWINACDHELVEMVRKSPMLPMLLDETTIANPEVVAKLGELGWAPLAKT